MEEIVLYRGINAHQEKHIPVVFYHEDPNFAFQFTHSGRPEEILKVAYPLNAIYKPESLPYGGDPDEMDAAIEMARSQGFTAVYADEGSGGTPSVAVFKKGRPLRVLGRCTHGDLGESKLHQIRAADRDYKQRAPHEGGDQGHHAAP